MEKNCKRFGASLLLLPVGMALVANVQADGYRNPPPTAAGIAKSGVHSAFVDDASAISYNPANLGMQTNHSLVVAGTFAQAQNTYSTAIPDLSTVPPGTIPVQIESDDPWQMLPNLYYSQPVGLEGKLVVGLGVNTPYGQSVSYDSADMSALVPPWAVGGDELLPYEATVKLVNFNPSAGVKIYDGVYLGLGLDVAYSSIGLKAVGNVPGTPLPPAPQPLAYVEGEGDGWGIGGNIGVTWVPCERHRVTATYRSRMDIKYKGDTTINGTNTGDFETTLQYPNTVGIGYGFEVSEDIRIEGLLEWLQWSVNDTQTIEVGGIGTEESVNNWDDTFTIGVSGSWDITESLVVRAGYVYLPSPIPDDTVTPLLPDNDRQVIGIGLGYTVGMHTLDVSYAFSIYDDRTSPIGSTSPGTYEIDSNLVGVSYSLTF